MKNKIFFTISLIFVFLELNLLAQELEINSSKIQYDNNNKVTIFEGNVELLDEKGNKLFSEYARYDKINQRVETTGTTKIITSKGFEVLSSNVIFDNKEKIILSKYKTQIIDGDNNKILVDMFNYSTLTNIFFSKGDIKVIDVYNNNYSFSEIYIDENKKKIIGSDVKAFLNQKNIGAPSSENEPRFFANTFDLSESVNTFEKGIFTYCKNKKDEKCPPWTLQSKKIKHDLAKKTIYYENVVLKVYDFPIFFSPKFSHPDPTVKRRSGLLAPSLTNSTTLGSGVSLPYFLNIANDRDLTLSPKLYFNENPLMLAEYRQDFKESYLIVDAGYTSGYKKKNNKKTGGDRSHIFARFNKKLINENEKKSDLEINLQNASNDTYFKVHDINTLLVDKDKNILENTIDYSYQNKDLFFGLSPSIYEDTNKSGHLRNEYLLPMSIEKNLLASAKYGLVDLSSSLKIRNYETNKQTNFFINNFNWSSNKWINKLGLENKFEGLIKTVNYKARNTSEYKNENSNAEISSVVGYFSKLRLYKNNFSKKNLHTLTPKVLIRYAPGHMRPIDKGRLNYQNLFNLSKINEPDVIESGFSSSLGFEYKKNKINENKNIGDEILSFAVGQVVSDRENMDIPSSTSLNQRFSDVVGEAKYNVSQKINLNYNFSIDQNYKKFNYNEISSDISFNKAKFNIGYLQERFHIGDQEFVSAGVDYRVNESNELNFSTKRNLLTSSAEFYNLSYNYINDCLKAGIAYRREFYTDRDIESDNRLMFTISIIPFAQINSPAFTK
ncbi:hypothetical protein OAB44_00115 [Pelagibacteraceae bacterium]|nr:hypothetical protein [Pelagibacteraceae bacterium]